LFDLLFFHGHTLLNKAIQSLTDSKYNHVAIYIGNGLVLHAVGNGLIVQKISEAIDESDKFVDVYRYHNTSDWLTLDQINSLIVTTSAYAQNKERYAVEALLILGILSQLRKDSNYASRRLLDDAFSILNNAFANGKEPVICSEIAYRVYVESGIPIEIIPEGLHEEYSTSIDKTLMIYKRIKKELYGVNPNFVTPHDLVMSPDIEFVAGLKWE
jgi:hypothetical protein